MNAVGIVPAFLAGIVSFLSPCVLPLVPGYISLMSGMSLEELTKGGSNKDAMKKAGLGSIFFVMGFSAVFTMLGATASAVGQLLSAYMGILSKAAGIMIILFGLHTTGLLTIKFLYFEKRFKTRGISPGYLGAFLMGIAFAFGWTPCIGPILAGILAMAAAQETVSQGVLLLFVYSMGLGIPFILTGFGVSAFMRFFARYKRFIRAGEIFAGLLLIAIGILIFTDNLTWLIRFVPKSFYNFSL